MSTEDFGLKTPVQARPARAPLWRRGASRRRTNAAMRARFSVVAAISDGCAAVLGALAAGLAYHLVFFGVVGVSNTFVTFTASMAALFVAFNVLRNEYEISGYLAFSGHARRAFVTWNIAFLTALLGFFMVKQLEEYSRISVLLVYVVGLGSVICCRAVVVARAKTDAMVGRVSAMRLFLIGDEAEIRAFTAQYRPWVYGVDIVASIALRGADTLSEDLALASASARVLKPDDIYILLPWSEPATIDTCVEALVKLPASIHLGPQPVLNRFSGVNVARIGQIYSLNIVRRPLAQIDVLIKRGFDLAVALPLLVVLTPLFLAVALAIKIDSRGPVVFLQRRYGFNQEPFRIVKFRTMRVAEEGHGVRQAERDDPRVTRVGRVLRRFNLDELPQLLNVVRGEMSLVGPRPHALVHDQYYERSIADYARRHNVKPGITGWAQIHGLRGAITSQSTMRQRVEHDLYYIDNWTIGLDLRIIVMTLVSPKAFANAF